MIKHQPLCAQRLYLAWQEKLTLQVNGSTNLTFFSTKGHSSFQSKTQMVCTDIVYGNICRILTVSFPTRFKK